MPDESGISVVICSYNGEKRIVETLRHLELQETSQSFVWEIILVNNASQDQTMKLAKYETQKFNTKNINFRIVEEPQPGLSFARQKGIAEAKYEFIIFCDDDNWLDKNYVETAYNLICRDSKIAALGGQSTATASVAIPSWFEGSKSNYAVGRQAISSGEVTAREYLWGSGIVIRKSIYEDAFLNFPSILTGRMGKQLSSGEDAEMCLRFILMGYKLYYSENLKFQHFISAERLTPEYNKKLEEGFYEAYQVLQLYSSCLKLIRLNLLNKLTLLFRSMMKMVLFKSLMEKEKLNIYLLSGFEYKGMNEKFLEIKYFYNSKKWLS